MERHEEMLSPEEQYAQLAPTLDTDGFSLYAAAEEITGLKVYCCFANKLRKIFIQSAKKKRRLKGF